MNPVNLYSLPPAGPDEVVSTLHEGLGIRIERIVSHGQSSPAGFWYDQPQHEWVVVVEGSARIEFDGGDARTLTAGDHLFIPAHCRHRVAWTAPDQPTIWLAVHHLVR